MARKHPWRDVVETTRPFLLLAIEYLIQQDKTTPYTTAARLLGSAIDHLVPDPRASKTVRKIRKTHHKLQALGEGDGAKRLVLQDKLSRQLDQL